MPVCVFCSGTHRCVLAKVGHPAGKTKVNQVLLDQILVPVQLLKSDKIFILGRTDQIRAVLIQLQSVGTSTTSTVATVK